MPSLCTPSPCNNTEPKLIGALLFDHHSAKTSRVMVLTVIPKNETWWRPRFPCLEAILGADSPVHDCSVTVQDFQGTEHRFLISCRYNPESEVNRGLQAILPDVEWRGPLSVMHQGRVAFVKNMDVSVALAKQAVCRFLLTIYPLLQQGADLNSEIPTSIPL